MSQTATLKQRASNWLSLVTCSQPITKLGFKDEDQDEAGNTIGPVYVYFGNGKYEQLGNTYFTRPQAKHFADCASVPLEEL